MSKFPTADALLALWQLPSSPRRLNFATWALYKVERKLGIEVLK